jgi:hypothetical protein
MLTLRDPAPAPESGGAPPIQPGPGAGADLTRPQPQAPPPHPDLAKPPAAPGEQRVQPIWVAPDDWSRQQNEMRALREFKAEADKATERAEAERIKLLTDKGQIEEAYGSLKSRYEAKLAAETTRAQTVEKQWLEEKRTTEVDRALAGRAFSGVDPNATAALVRRLLGEEIEAVLGPEGKPDIRDRKTLRPAADYLKERLDSPDLAIFFAATNRGGAGTDGARPAAATPNPTGDPNKAFAEAYLRRRADAQAARF